MRYVKEYDRELGDNTFYGRPLKNVVKFGYDKRRRDVYERQLKRGF